MSPPHPCERLAPRKVDTEVGPSNLGPAIYEILWSAAALEVVILLGHLVGVILFAVDDYPAVWRSLLGFSLFIWVLAGLYMIPTVVTHRTRVPFEDGPIADDYLDAPWFEGGKPDPRPDEG